jgi:hypothetical protein
MKKLVYLLSIVCIILFTGYYRDSVFKNINALIKAKDFDMDYSMPGSLHFLQNYNYDTLLNVKWLLTFLFSAIYFLITFVTVKVLFGNKKYGMLTFIAYLAVVSISILLIFTGYIFPALSEKMYEFARYLMGMAQSPIILMVLIPAFKISETAKM